MSKDLRDQFIDSRLAANQTQMEVAIELGCGLSTVSRFETKNIIPSSKAVIKNIKTYIAKHKPK